MIKTLRITSVIAVVLAVVFFVFPAVFGVRGDKQIEQFLSSAGAIEQFKKARGGKIEDKRSETSPLVKQAEAFALYLNPPPKPKAAPTVLRSRPRPKQVSAKFKLVGTSRHSLHPEMSLALIDEPGKGLHWVRASGKVGHLVIEQVRDGLIVVRDGSSTFEVVAERPEKRSSIKVKSLSSGRITDSKLPEISTEVPISDEEKTAETELQGAIDELLKLEQARASVGDDLSPEDKEEQAAFQTEVKKVIADMRKLEQAQARAEADLSHEDKKGALEREKLVSELETMRISAKEARGLDRLGRRLKKTHREPNRVANSKTESKAD